MVTQAVASGGGLPENSCWGSGLNPANPEYVTWCESGALSPGQIRLPATGIYFIQLILVDIVMVDGDGSGSVPPVVVRTNINGVATPIPARAAVNGPTGAISPATLVATAVTPAQAGDTLDFVVTAGGDSDTGFSFRPQNSSLTIIRLQ
jgi:hypothetical protein